MGEENSQKPDRLDEAPFSYRVLKDDRVQIHCEGRPARALKGKEAVRFLDRLEGLSPREGQRLMARVTGQFKFGNER